MQLEIALIAVGNLGLLAAQAAEDRLIGIVKVVLEPQVKVMQVVVAPMSIPLLGVITDAMHTGKRVVVVAQGVRLLTPPLPIIHGITILL